MKKQLIMINHIKEFREILGVSAQDVADAIGVSRNTIYSIERHKMGPSGYHAGLLCKYFNCTFEELFDMTSLKKEIDKQIPGQLEIEFK